MQLWKKQKKKISEVFSIFLWFKLNFEHLEKKKDEPHSICTSEITDSKRHA